MHGALVVLTFLSKSGSVAWCVDACVVEEDLDWIDLLSASKTAARVCFVSFPFPHRSCTPSPRVPAVSPPFCTVCVAAAEAAKNREDVAPTLGATRSAAARGAVNDLFVRTRTGVALAMTREAVDKTACMVR